MHTSHFNSLLWIFNILRSMVSLRIAFVPHRMLSTLSMLNAEVVALSTDVPLKISDWEDSGLASITSMVTPLSVYMLLGKVLAELYTYIAIEPSSKYHLKLWSSCVLHVIMTGWQRVPPKTAGTEFKLACGTPTFNHPLRLYGIS